MLRSSKHLLVLAFAAWVAPAAGAGGQEEDTIRSTDVDRKVLLRTILSSAAAPKDWKSGSTLILYEGAQQELWSVADREAEEALCGQTTGFCNATVLKWLHVRYARPVLVGDEATSSSLDLAEAVARWSNGQCVMSNRPRVFCLTDRWMSASTHGGWFLDRTLTPARSEYTVGQAIDLLQSQYGLERGHLEPLRQLHGDETVALAGGTPTVRDLLCALLLREVESGRRTYRVVPFCGQNVIEIKAAGMPAATSWGVLLQAI